MAMKKKATLETIEKELKGFENLVSNHKEAIESNQEQIISQKGEIDQLRASLGKLYQMFADHENKSIFVRVADKLLRFRKPLRVTFKIISYLLGISGMIFGGMLVWAVIVEPETYTFILSIIGAIIILNGLITMLVAKKIYVEK